MNAYAVEVQVPSWLQEGERGFLQQVEADSPLQAIDVAVRRTQDENDLDDDDMPFATLVIEGRLIASRPINSRDEPGKWDGELA